MRSPNTGGDTRESGRKSSGKILWPGLATAAAALLIALHGNIADTPESHIDKEWDRDSTKTGWVNPSGQPGQGRYRGGKAFIISEPDGARTFKLTEYGAGYRSNQDGTYYPPETWEYKIGKNGDTTAVHTVDIKDLFPKVDYFVTEHDKQSLTGITKIWDKIFNNRKVITEDMFNMFQAEFGNLLKSPSDSTSLEQEQQDEKN